MEDISSIFMFLLIHLHLFFKTFMQFVLLTVRPETNDNAFVVNAFSNEHFRDQTMNTALGSYWNCTPPILSQLLDPSEKNAKLAL